MLQPKDKKSYEDLERENLLLHSIIENVSDAVYVVDKDGKIILINHSFEKQEGIKKSQVLGKKDTEVYSFSPEKFQRLVVMKNNKPMLEQRMNYTLNGKKIDSIYNSYPFYETGKLSAVYCLCRDMTTITELLTRYSNLLNNRNLIQKTNNTKYTLEDIVGASLAIKKTIGEAGKVAQTRSTILLHGETGTGKELFAQGIHNAGSYAQGPFVAVNCAAIPENLMESILMGTVKGAFSGALDMPGLFEQAENGTIFLDEINSLGKPLQAKLLRLLQDRTVRRIGDKTQRKINCRVISATNQDLYEAVKNGQFRLDLFYRLAHVILNISPLRERPEDIPVLLEYFITRYNHDFNTSIKQIAPEMLEQFSIYNWPGNVRELEHVVESALCMTEHTETVLSLKHLPEFIKKQILKTPMAPMEFAYFNVDAGEGESELSFDEFRRQCEKNFIEKTLKKTRGNVSEAAKKLGITRQNLHYHMSKLSIKLSKY